VCVWGGSSTSLLGLSVGDKLFLSHGGHDGHEDILIGLLIGHELLHHLGLVGGQLQILLGLAVLEQEGHESVVRDVEQLVLILLHEGDLHVVGRGAGVLVFLAGEDIDPDDGRLGVAVLAGLRGGHFHHSAGHILQHGISSLLDVTGLTGVCVA